MILGYELFNEPIAPYFPNMEELNGKLEDIYKKGVAAIREGHQPYYPVGRCTMER